MAKINGNDAPEAITKIQLLTKITSNRLYLNFRADSPIPGFMSAESAEVKVDGDTKSLYCSHKEWDWGNSSTVTLELISGIGSYAIVSGEAKPSYSSYTPFTINTPITFKRSDLSNIILDRGEPLFDTNNDQLYIGKSDTVKVAFYNKDQVDNQIKTEATDRINALDYNDTVETDEFVTAVMQTDGKIAVTHTRPTASNISYSNTDSELSASDVQAAIDAEVSARSQAVDDLAGDGRTTDQTIKGNADAIAQEKTERQNAIASLDSKLEITEVSEPSISTPQTLIKSITQTDGKLTELSTLDLVDDIVASTLGGKTAQKNIGGISQGSKLGNTLAQILSDLFGIGTFTVTNPSVNLKASIGNPSNADFLEYGQEADINLIANFNSGKYPYGSLTSPDSTDTGVTISNYGDNTYSNDDIKFTSNQDATAKYSQDSTPNTITYSSQTITSNNNLSSTITYTVAVNHTSGDIPLDADGKEVSDKAIAAGSVIGSASIDWYRAFFMGALKSEITDVLETQDGRTNYIIKLSTESIRSLSKFKAISGTYEIMIPEGSWGVLFVIPESLTPNFTYLRNGSYITFPVIYVGKISLPDASGLDITKIKYKIYAYDADMPYEAAMNVKVQIN